MEQDAHNLNHSDELPTYIELAAQAGPNSRFGRWKDWVEKRAAERYADDTPERREARRSRGWGPTGGNRAEHRPLPPIPSSQPPLLSPPDPGLNRTQTMLSNPPDTDPKLPPTVTLCQSLPPSHLRIHSFGSRFLPHSELPILSCLPLFNHRKLLLGHMDGLTLLDMDPMPGSSDVQAKEPRRREIWYGEGVYQMAILEHEQGSLSRTPVGVVLVLVGAEPPESGSEKEVKEPFKTVRMYNLASLADLVRWAATRKVPEPLDLRRVGNWQPQQKKHRNIPSMPRRATHDDGAYTNNVHSPASPPKPPPKDRPNPSPSVAPPLESSLSRLNSTDSWEVVNEDEVPLRWATDFVPLASPSSRLANQSVQFFELYRNTDGGRVTARLAVVTKQSILLYETVRRERAFRFVKEFYTPSVARGVTFVVQDPNDPQMGKFSLSPTETFTTRNAGSDISSRRVSSILPQTPYRTPQLSLFVIFEKKAGLIKISDSSVGELELWERQAHSRRVSSSFPMSVGSSRRLASISDSASSSKALKGAWAPPAEAVLPITNTRSFSLEGIDTKSVYLLTRGRITHIVQSPLPMPLAAHEPLAVLKWGMRPSRVVPRVCEHPRTAVPFLQVTALGEEGVEVQELGLAFLRPKGRAEDTLHVVMQAAVGPGGAGFLCMGGHWTEGQRRESAGGLQRQLSASTVDTLDLLVRREREAGFYAWTQYAVNDWRVFWLGGDAKDGEVSPISP